MTHLGLSDAEKLAIYGIVAGVLHLGNAMFEDDPGSKGVCISERSSIIIVIVSLPSVSGIPRGLEK